MVTHRKIIEHFLLVLFLCLMKYDRIRGTKLSEQEDFELEKQLKLLNKPAIKTIKTEYGDIFDCVDFYNQPAFHHPLLKNHNYHPQMKPLSFMKEGAPTASMGLPGKGCPVGTVPIRRYTKKDLIRHKLLPPSEDNVVEPPRTNRDNFNDSKARRIKHFDDGRNSCFDLLCPSFVLVSEQVSFGQPFPNISKIQGNLFDWAFQIKWDQENGNWWLFLEESGYDYYIPIGFWPREVFDDDFDNYATRVEWGGVVYSPAGILEPPMGSGTYPLIKSAKAHAYCRNITLWNDKGEYINLLGNNLTTFSTTPTLYNVIDIPDFGHHYNHTILYGGPGDI